MSRTFVTRWIAATLIVSIIAFIDNGWLAQWITLAPTRVWNGEVWRLVTWVLIVPSPISLVVTCFAIYKFGGDLGDRWGERRFRRFAIELVAAAALITCLLSIITGDTGAHVGGVVMTFSLVIAWARQFPEQKVMLYGMVPIHGRNLMALIGGLTILFALHYGIYEMAPELAACAIAAGYPRGWLAR
jgi:membrane associated rhomboid family serine protease